MRRHRASCMRIAVRMAAAATALVVAAGTAADAADLIEAVRGRDHDAVATLLAAGADVDARQPDGATALHWAAHQDDLETVQRLLAAGADARAANDYGATPVWLAATNGNAAIAAALLDAGADPNAALESGETVLMAAARTGTPAVLAALLDAGADIEAAQTSRGQTALMWAVAENRLEAARLLLERGADVHARSRTSTTIDPRGARTQVSEEAAAADPPDAGEAAGETSAIKEATTLGALERKSGGFTPLMFAARHGDLAMARLLLDHGGAIDDVDAEGSTPLLVATVRGHVPFALLLLERGAAPDGAPEVAGYTPLNWAVNRSEALTSHDYPDAPGEWAALAGIPDRRQQLALIEALLDHGADVNAQLTNVMPRYGFSLYFLILPPNTMAGSTPFLLAATAGDAETMRLLVDRGADPLLAAAGGMTPLMMAAGAGWVINESLVPEADRLAAVKLAHALGNDVNATDRRGFNAVHCAAYAGLVTVIEYLAAAGADINHVGENGQSPLGVAEGQHLAQFVGSQPASAAALRGLGAVSVGAVTLESAIDEQARRRELQGR